MDPIVNKLSELWMYDVSVFSQGWIYWWFLIPFIFYFVFFVFKWTILTLPVWLPCVIILQANIQYAAEKDEDDD